MPDYKVLPQIGEVSIEQALAAGKRSITYPSRMILLLSAVLGGVLLFCKHSFWAAALPVLAGIVISYIYTVWKTPQWRIWAYAGVRDIHQFQRAAELELLLPRQSPLKMTGIMSWRQWEQLVSLQERFKEDPPFIDDPEVAPVSRIYASSLLPHAAGEWPEVTITDEGIDTEDYGFFPWGSISLERVASKSYTTVNWWTGGERSGVGGECFCFSGPDYHVEIPLDDLDVSAAALDQMLYIHRGRYELRAKEP